MIALSLHTHCSLGCIEPATELNDIFGIQDDDWIDLPELEWHQMWLADVFKDAKIRTDDIRAFRGKRLSDVLQFAWPNA